MHLPFCTCPPGECGRWHMARLPWKGCHRRSIKLSGCIIRSPCQSNCWRFLLHTPRQHAVVVLLLAITPRCAPAALLPFPCPCKPCRKHRGQSHRPAHIDSQNLHASWKSGSVGALCTRSVLQLCSAVRSCDLRSVANMHQCRESYHGRSTLTRPSACVPRIPCDQPKSPVFAV